ncbi:MAG: hypothetical protein ABFC84_16510 [Veillonellales bacterium]
MLTEDSYCPPLSEAAEEAMAKAIAEIIIARMEAANASEKAE